MARVDVNKHTSILLLGKADSNNYRKEIVYADKPKYVEQTFGDSELTQAYKTLKSLGAPDIFLCNCREYYDYIDLSNLLKDHDFAYIVPVSLNLSDEFDDSATERRISYIEYLIEQIGHTNESVFVMTDKHANLYEDMDAFIKDMNSVASSFARKKRMGACGENVIFVANNLYNYERANLPLVASLVTTKVNQYPTLNFGPAYFLLDQYENIGNWAYFQNHTVRPTTVENLLNFEGISPQKVVFISRILKMLKRQMDFSEFIGKQYTEYRKLSVQNKLDEYLSQAVGKLIYNYNILSTVAYRNPEPMTVNIENTFEVWPINCLEKVTLSKTVEVA